MESNRNYAASQPVTSEPVAASSGAYYFDLPLLDLGGPLPLRFSLISDYRSDLDRLAPSEPADLPDHFWWSPKATALLVDDQCTIQLADGNQVSFQKVGGVWELEGPDPAGPVDNGSKT